MGLIWTLVVGLIVGALAKFFMPGDDPGGVVVTMLLGVAGAFVATFLGRAIGLYDGSSAGIIMSIVGAMVLLFAYRAIRGRAASAHRS
ncbi:MAG TPA: GlsB/YeaQ/YmgE family stress response membrane protein [Candidatus Saccharimonadales bacterium]|nr:GlsB/YeaQ/YmgE family stress response membrane protein [Candidatus Saccharimonadales bacterium]